MTTILFAAAVALLIWQNKRLSEQIAALTARQEQTEQSISRLSRKTKKTTAAQRRFDRRLQQQRQKQERIQKEQEKIRKEQCRQSEALRKAEHKLSLALSDIQAQETRLSQLFAVLDCLKAQQAGVMPGSNADIRLQRQIIVVENQVSAAERRIAQARYNEQEARQRIAA